jgi:hypothetical protein
MLKRNLFPLFLLFLSIAGLTIYACVKDRSELSQKNEGITLLSTTHSLWQEIVACTTL